MDQKTYLKNMINAMIEKDQDKAASELHSYLAKKMQSTLSTLQTAQPAPAEAATDVE